MGSPQRTVLSLAEGNWHYINAVWQEGADGVLSVPADLVRAEGPGIQSHHYAINRDLIRQDMTVRFDFRLTPHSDVGLILRATSASRFYLLHFPDCGQASRAQHFWVALSRMDPDGYLRCLKLELVPRVPSVPRKWMSAEVVLSGDKVDVKIAEHGRFEARLERDGYRGPGRVGLYACGRGEVRQVEIEAEPSASSRWDNAAEQPTNWFHPAPDEEPRIFQRPTDLVRLPDGELLLTYGRKDMTGQGRGPAMRMVRSTDDGWSWSAPEPVEPAGRLHMTPAGRLIKLITAPEGNTACQSPDGAHSWDEPEPVNIAAELPGVPRVTVCPQAFINQADGSMVVLLHGAPDLGSLEDLWTWGSGHCQAFTSRSTDDGRTWSTPVNIDNPGLPEIEPHDGNLDLTEVCGTQMGNGSLMALIRPIYSPWMWETWSRDGGVTWGPCVLGPFPGYATANMLRTSSGAVIVSHRLPSMTLHTSRDDGHTWDQGTLIDGALWAMGCMIEIEPDVVLYAYRDCFEGRMRIQFIRVTPERLEPIPPR